MALSLGKASANPTAIVREAIFRAVPTAADLGDLKEARTPGTCKWILDVGEYKAWRDDEARSRMLWISGGAGKGKTILSAFLVEKLLYLSQAGGGGGHDESVARVIYCFCNSQGNDTAQAILTSLVAQLIQKAPHLIDHAVARFMLAKVAEDVHLTEDALWGIFVNMMQDPRAGRVYCVLDGLDECQEKSQAQLIDKFDKFFSASSNTTASSGRAAGPGRAGPGLRLAIVSQVLGKLEKTATKLVRLNLEDHTVQQGKDIHKYISDWVKRAADGMQGVDERWLREVLVDGANGSFLWPQLVLGEIDHIIGPSQADVKETIEKFPTGLGDCYKKALRRVCRSPKDTEHAARILRWVALAVRPLTVAELAVALECYQGGGGLETAKASLKAMIARLEPLLRVSQPGITPGALYSGDLNNPQGEVVTIIHPSARSHLLDLGERPGEGNILQQLAIERGAGHLELARRCVQLLEHHYQDLAKTRAIAVSGRPGQATLCACSGQSPLPLLAYSALHWAQHARAAGHAGLPPTTLFSDFPFFGTVSVARQAWQEKFNEMRKLAGVPQMPTDRLFLACFGGFDGWAKLLLKKRRVSIWHQTERYAIKIRQWFRIKEPSPDFDRAFGLAVELDRQDLVKMFLKDGANANLIHEPFIEGRGARPLLTIAVQINSHGLVKLLLKEGADPNISVDLNQRPLWAALFTTYCEDLAQLLFHKGARLSTVERPLFQAVLTRDAETVQLVLDLGAADLLSPAELGDIQDLIGDDESLSIIRARLAPFWHHTSVLDRFVNDATGPESTSTAAEFLKCAGQLICSLGGDSNFAFVLLSRAGGKYMPDQAKTECLLGAVRGGNRRLVQQLLDEYGADVNDHDKNGFGVFDQLRRRQGLEGNGDAGDDSCEIEIKRMLVEYCTAEHRLTIGAMLARRRRTTLVEYRTAIEEYRTVFEEYRTTIEGKKGKGRLPTIIEAEHPTVIKAEYHTAIETEHLGAMEECAIGIAF